MSGGKKRKPDSVKAIAWRGPLTPAVAADGINAAYRNARRLLKDAEQLAATGSYPTATALAVLAIEEHGKASIIHLIVLAKNPDTRKKHWQEYTSHTAKNAAWVLLNLIKAGAKTLDDFRIIFDESSPHPFILDDFKQWGFYTDCRGRMWSEPEKQITPEICREVLTCAVALIRTARDYTAEQMECYVRHLSPVWIDIDRPTDAERQAMRKAMADYSIECQQQGWMSPGLDPAEFFRTAAEGK